MACERTASGICKNSLRVMTENTSIFYRKAEVYSHFYASEKDAWVAAMVNVNFVDLCQEVVDITEKVVKESKELLTWSRDRVEFENLRISLEDSMWRLLQKANEDVGRWAEVICKVGHHTAEAIEAESNSLTEMREKEWRPVYEKFLNAVNEAGVNKAMKKGIRKA